MSPKTKLHTIVLLISLVSFAPNMMAQKGSKKGTDPGKTVGVSVSPSHFHFNQKQGEVKTYDITIKNSTSLPKEFNINIYDFDMNGKGKSSFLPPGKGKFSLAKWVNLSPTFVSLKPFENKKVKVTVSIPSDDSGKKNIQNLLSNIRSTYT